MGQCLEARSIEGRIKFLTYDKFKTLEKDQPRYVALDCSLDYSKKVASEEYKF